MLPDNRTAQDVKTAAAPAADGETDPDFETDRAMWAIACLLVSVIIVFIAAGITLAALFVRGHTPWLQ